MVAATGEKRLEHLLAEREVGITEPHRVEHVDHAIASSRSRRDRVGREVVPVADRGGPASPRDVLALGATDHRAPLAVAGRAESGGDHGGRSPGGCERAGTVPSMDVGPVLDRVAALTPAASTGRGFLLVGIGGRGGSGKTTLARSLPAAQVVGTDEFWDGTGFELSRLRSEVLEPILRAEPAEYHAYSWQLRRPLEQARVVLPQGVIVVEGVCALHQLLREAYDLRIWVEAPRELRLARGVRPGRRG